MIRIGGILSFLIFFGAELFAQSIIERNGTLHVAAGKIVNAKGIEPQLRGISFSWSIWGGKKYYNTQVVDWLCKDFNVSIIRLSMAVQPHGGYLEKPEEQMGLITELVDRAIQNGIYVLIDWHDHNADKHLTQAKTFFAQMARRYAGKPNVIYEIWNEPEQQSWPVVKDYALQVIQEIRKYDNQNLIIVGSPHWDQDVDVVADSPIVGYSNLAYSFHFYASDPSHQDSLRSKAEYAMAKGLALLVTEWGVGEADGNGKFDLQKTTKWLNWMEQHKLSWTNWNITDKRETTALLKPGSSSTGGWATKHLTPAGKYIRSELQKLNRR